MTYKERVKAWNIIQFSKWVLENPDTFVNGKSAKRFICIVTAHFIYNVCSKDARYRPEDDATDVLSRSFVRQHNVSFLQMLTLSNWYGLKPYGSPAIIAATYINRN